MIQHNRSMLLALLLMTLFTGSHALSFAYDSTGVSSTYVIRTQLQRIADEVVDSAKFDIRGRVAVLVEGEGRRTLAENAFIEALRKRNYASVVIDTISTNQILHLFIFNTEMKISELNAKISERNIRTTLEARVIKGTDRQVWMLGTFHMETKDTAQAFTSGMLPETQKNDESGILQRMLTPFIIVGGAIVIVYLFFTVRS